MQYMITKKFFDTVYPKFEKFIVLLLAVAVMVAIAYATVTYFAILIKTIIVSEPVQQALILVETGKSVGGAIERLQTGLYHVFGGFLLILLGIELIGTIKTFSEENHIKIESIIAIAIIATSRHLITLDYHHADAMVIFGAGFVVFVLILGYFLMKLKIVTGDNDKKSQTET